ncbi:unnamed protein product [Paramecium primaurelia]|uniref:ubiquitinyl hydrolase 1 n=1 Tax=Paramecium primaurelia TaxID=5886 RepID=A0A8S1LTN7_PARPR|nr:unnamed protein product [Paramecium primaurelia]
MQQSKEYEHQTQNYRRCGLHAVNNLLQQNKYTRQDFENIAEEIKKETSLSHYTYFLGNYDLNVIERILLKESYEIVWVRQNQEINEELIADPQVYGLLISLIKEMSFIEKLCNWDPRHWVSIRKVIKHDDELEFYYHDSSLKAPQIKQTPDMIQELKNLQMDKAKENYILLVKKR